MTEKRGLLMRVLIGLSATLIILGLYLVFIYVPTEAQMGIVQRIFYVMVPMGWLSLLSFVIIFIASIRYLRSRDRRWDILGSAAAEVGMVFTTLALITGMLWAKPVWGVWWTWEPRLTSTLVLWFIYLAYFLVRSFATERARGATFAAVIGVLGFIDVPIIGLSTSLWRGMHPQGLIFQGGLAPQMLVTLIVNVIAFTVLYSVLLAQSVSVKTDQVEISKLRELRNDS